jgi:hypothetical protein
MSILEKRSYCIEHTSTQFMGWKNCYNDETGCFVSGDRCYGQAADSRSPASRLPGVGGPRGAAPPHTTPA